MYDGKKHEHSTRVNGQDGYDRVIEFDNGVKEFYKVETWDDRELEPHKEKYKVLLKDKMAELYDKWAPLHKQLNASLGVLPEIEHKDMLRCMRILAAEYLLRKNGIDSAVDCDEVESMGEFSLEAEQNLEIRLKG